MMLFSRNERGDTLVEVTIALTILSAVLMSAFVVANRAYQVGLSANERTRQIALAQRQAELLTNFRDSHTWKQFLDGLAGPTGYNGINVRNNPTCGVANNRKCFHMVEPDGASVTIIQPENGAVGLNIGGGGASGVTSFVDIRTLEATSSGAPADLVNGPITFAIRYGTDRAGTPGGTADNRNVGSIYLTLANIDGFRQK